MVKQKRNEIGEIYWFSIVPTVLVSVIFLLGFLGFTSLADQPNVETIQEPIAEILIENGHQPDYHPIEK